MGWALPQLHIWPDCHSSPLVHLVWDYHRLMRHVPPETQTLVNGAPLRMPSPEGTLRRLRTPMLKLETGTQQCVERRAQQCSQVRSIHSAAASSQWMKQELGWEHTKLHSFCGHQGIPLVPKEQIEDPELKPCWVRVDS